ncbi:MAG: diacylglycerol kinase family protein [Bacteroidota bacterium]
MMEGKRKIRFIINPVSGIGRQRIVERRVEKYLDHSKFEHEICYTEFAGHAVDLSRDAAEQGVDIVVAAGGDGSINEVARGVLGSKTAIGIIPVGSGNGLAHFLRIPRSIKKALRIINRHNVKIIDTANINDKLFVSIAGIGFDAYVAEKFARSTVRGFWTYAWIILKEYTLFKSNHFKFYINGEMIKRRAFMVSFANSDQFGFNCAIAPKAKIDDGLLDVCIVSKPNILFAPLLVPLMFAKVIDITPWIEIIRTSEIHCFQLKNFIAHIDGDQVHLTKELIVKVNPASVRVLVP